MINTVQITGYGDSPIRTTALARKVVDVQRINKRVWYQCEIGTCTTGPAYHWYPARRVVSATNKVTRPALQAKPCTALMIRPTNALMEVIAHE